MIVIKNWIIILYNGISWDLIGLAAILYEPLYHAKEIETIKLSPGCSSKAKSANLWRQSRPPVFSENH